MEQIEKYIELKLKTLRPISEKTIGIYIACFWMALNTLSAVSDMNFLGSEFLSIQSQILLIIVPALLSALATYGLYHFKRWSLLATAASFAASFIFGMTLANAFFPSILLSGVIVVAMIYWNRESLS